MAQVMEYSGRLTRSDKRPANPGRYDLLFGIHAANAEDRPLWEETLRSVDVVPGGFFRVVLGRSTQLTALLFADGPRWLSVRVIRGKDVDVETAPRVPVAGLLLALDARVAVLERRVGPSPSLAPASVVVKVAAAKPKPVATVGSSRAKKPQVVDSDSLIEQLRLRLDAFEADLEAADLGGALGDLSQRLLLVDDEEDGRLIQIEDELEDLIGPEGDVVDLNERMDRIEGQAPRLIASLRAREAELSRERVSVLRAEVDSLVQRVSSLRELLADVRLRVEEVADRHLPSAEDVGAVSRQGDVMTGGLTINRGGLDVLSGGVNCRGATVNSLEASNMVKASKVIAGALELRGDLTVDNTHRAVQVRLVEGRQGSSRRDGALYLNGRSGFEVVVGTAQEARGVAVFGPVSGASYQADGVGFAQTFDVYGRIDPGQVACMRPDGGKIEFSKSQGDVAVIGVCVDSAGVLTGGSTKGGRAVVTLAGVAMVLAQAGAGIGVGDLLVSGPGGVAQRAPDDCPRGAVLGKALSPLAEAQGLVAVLVGAR